MKKINEIQALLNNFREDHISEDIKLQLKKLKQIELSRDNEINANNIWCVQQIEKIISHYLEAFNLLNTAKYLNAWNELDRADIELSFLKPHFDYFTHSPAIVFIEDKISQIQKLYPYQYFFSRESITLKSRCSICNSPISLRNSCDHVVGELYNGEQCGVIIEQFELTGIALVEDPFDKYAVIQPIEMKYNYSMLDQLMKKFKHPFEEWTLVTHKEIKEEFKSIGRNQLCICESGEKFKKCCLKKNIYTNHYEVIFLNKSVELIRKTQYSTWKY